MILVRAPAMSDACFITNTLHSSVLSAALIDV